MSDAMVTPPPATASVMEPFKLVRMSRARVKSDPVAVLFAKRAFTAARPVS